MSNNLLFEHGEPLTEATLRRVYNAVEDIALNDLGLDIYPNRFVVVNDMEMIAAMASNGMPTMYHHWSFGKSFLKLLENYKASGGGLPYEMIINTDPCISWNMTNNSMALTTLVVAHAAFGHNHFFKNNMHMRNWTKPSGWHLYLQFAKEYVAQCESKYGQVKVEKTLDAAHTLFINNSISRFKEPPELTFEQELARAQRMRDNQLEHIDYDLVDLLPESYTQFKTELPDRGKRPKRNYKLPEDNILLFIEKHSPILHPWQRELVRIVRLISQHYYPNIMSKMMNEGCATFTHNYIINELHRQGKVDFATAQECNKLNVGVLFQRKLKYHGPAGFSAPINPYAFGYDMCQEIVRISQKPTEWDKKHLKHIAGMGDWRKALHEYWRLENDETAILNYLSLRMVQNWRPVVTVDCGEYLHVTADHSEAYFDKMRHYLASYYRIETKIPFVQVVGVNEDDHTLYLQHYTPDGRTLEPKSRDMVLELLEEHLWGRDIDLHEAQPMQT